MDIVWLFFIDYFDMDIGWVYGQEINMDLCEIWILVLNMYVIVE